MGKFRLTLDVEVIVGEEYVPMRHLGFLFSTLLKIH